MWVDVWVQLARAEIAEQYQCYVADSLPLKLSHHAISDRVRTCSSKPSRRPKTTGNAMFVAMFHSVKHEPSGGLYA